MALTLTLLASWPCPYLHRGPDPTCIVALTLLASWPWPCSHRPARFMAQIALAIAVNNQQTACERVIREAAEGRYGTYVEKSGKSSGVAPELGMGIAFKRVHRKRPTMTGVMGEGGGGQRSRRAAGDESERSSQYKSDHPSDGRKPWLASPSGRCVPAACRATFSPRSRHAPTPFVPRFHGGLTRTYHLPAYRPCRVSMMHLRLEQIASQGHQNGLMPLLTLLPLQVAS